MQELIRDMQYEAITHIGNDEDDRKKVFDVVFTYSSRKHIPFEQGLLEVYAHSLHAMLKANEEKDIKRAQHEATFSMVCQYELLKMLGVLPK